jgi:hypothetical protein
VRSVDLRTANPALDLRILCGLLWPLTTCRVDVARSTWQFHRDMHLVSHLSHIDCRPNPQCITKTAFQCALVVILDKCIVHDQVPCRICAFHADFDFMLHHPARRCRGFYAVIFTIIIMPSVYHMSIFGTQNSIISR